jgi:hypothetical protein
MGSTSPDRRPLLCALALGALAGGCTSSGGAAPPPPTLVAASFLGAGATPAAGDLLLLTTSKPVAAVAGAALDDQDFELAPSGSLGSAPVLSSVSDRLVQVTLGAGASFVPGSTTIAFRATNDAVRSLDGALGVGGTPRTIEVGDGDQPVLSNLTLNAIQDALNGEGPAGGVLLVPRSGFTIDLSFTDPSSAIDAAATSITSNVGVEVAGVVRAPGENLADALPLTATTTTASFAVPAATVRFADGLQSLTALIVDATGMSSPSVSFQFLVRALEDRHRPFELTQTWYLDSSRDLESFDADFDIVAGANSRTDLEDLFHGIGLLTATPITVGSQGDSNGVVLGIWRTRVLADLAVLFDGVDVSFTFTAPGVFPPDRNSVAYTSFGFSQICIAGASGTSPTGILGSALLDPNNETQNDDCLTDFQGSRLGVFLHASLYLGIRSGPTTMFRQTFDPFFAPFGGTPIGAAAGDDLRLLEVLAGTNTMSDARVDGIDLALTRISRLTAVVLAHECGHSMGLVANGPMPIGLYGDDPVNFPLAAGQPPSAASGHIQNTALFPSGAQNVMSPAIDFDAAQSPFTTFNTLNHAYLRERVIYVPQ